MFIEHHAGGLAVVHALNIRRRFQLNSQLAVKGTTSTTVRSGKACAAVLSSVKRARKQGMKRGKGDSSVFMKR